MGLAQAVVPLIEITRGHQDRVVDGGPQLNRGDNDRSDEGQLRSGVAGNAKVDGDGELDDRDQYDGQGHRFQYKGDDDEDEDDRNPADYLEVVVRNRDQILGTGGFADYHGIFVVFFDDIVYGVDLGVDLVRRRLVLGIDQSNFIVPVLQDFPHVRRDHIFRNGRTDEGAKTQGALDPVQLVDLRHHPGLVVGIHRRVIHDEIGIVDFEIIFKNLLGLHAGKTVRQGADHIVIDARVVTWRRRRSRTFPSGYPAPSSCRCFPADRSGCRN